MFTGIVETAVPIRSFRASGRGARLVLPAPAEELAESWRVVRGQSVAVSGVCLSVAQLYEPGTENAVPDGEMEADMAFDLSAETLSRTWLARCADPGPDLRVNLERALRIGSRLDGHLVAGHVDGLGRVVAIDDTGDGGREFTIETPPTLARFLVDKGSITVDGISLTVVEPEGPRFRVAVIPVTLEVTSLGWALLDDPVHLEADMIGKWVDWLMVR